MNEYTRFESQYIMMLALRARQELQQQQLDQPGPMDSNLKNYIEALETIANKAKENIKELDQRESEK
jgi:hypothetical protein